MSRLNSEEGILIGRAAGWDITDISILYGCLMVYAFWVNIKTLGSPDNVTL